MDNHKPLNSRNLLVSPSDLEVAFFVYSPMQQECQQIVVDTEIYHKSGPDRYILQDTAALELIPHPGIYRLLVGRSFRFQRRNLDQRTAKAALPV